MLIVIVFNIYVHIELKLFLKENICYLPNDDVTITFMHQHFITKFPESDCNYISHKYYQC